MAALKKVALVHDWLNGYRGGERVLEQLCHLFPEADIYTLFYRKNTIHPTIERHRISASWLNRLPGAHRFYRYLFPLYPYGIESFSFKDYELVISTSHCAAKGIITPADVPHLCYCFTPVRYAWDKYDDYFKGHSMEPLLALAMKSFREWDVLSSQRVDHFIAISEWVSKRIRKYYRRGSSVIYPPVDTDFFRAPSNTVRGDYYLIVSAFAPYKRIDLAIEACARTNRRLLVVGEGQRSAQLRSQGAGKVEFLGRVATPELPRLYAGAKALIFPGEEDFGIVPLEAQACGTPVIAYGKGGALETVLDQSSGLFFGEPTVESLLKALEDFERDPKRFSECRVNAERFSTPRFLSEFASEVRRFTSSPVAATTRALPEVPFPV